MNPCDGTVGVAGRGVLQVVVVKTCAVDANGLLNLSASNLWHRAIAERARIVVVEVDAGLPYLEGVDNGLHVSEVDYSAEA
ncbi:MAG: hypothetical protein M3O26_11590 [Pseudomonadota bacterium]|nr:hypothetical protein [Pseudomonadota bacterium]